MWYLTYRLGWKTHKFFMSVKSSIMKALKFKMSFDKNHKEKLEQKFTFSIAHSRLQYQFKK